MAQPVLERVGVAVQRLASATVDHIRGHPRFHQRHRFCLCPPHRVDHLALLRRRLTHHDGAGAVAVVAAGARPEVDHDHVASLQHAIRRPPVRQRAAFSCRDDGVERRSIRTELPERLLQQECDIALAQARPDRRLYPIEGATRDLGDAAKEFDFVRGFEHPQAFNQARRRGQPDLDRQGCGKALMLLDREVLGLEAGALQSESFHPLRHEWPQPMRRSRPHQREARRLRLHL